jgi:Mg2+-importing ATPase
VAIIEYVEKSNVISSQPNLSERVKSPIASRFFKVDEIPFDFVRRRMSVILQSRNNCLLITKGAVDEMIDICSYIYLGENITEGNIPSFSKEILSMGTKNDFESKVELNDLKIPKDENILKLTPHMISNLKRINDLLNGDGIRVVAVAYKKFNEMPNEFQRSDEKDLIFAGFVGFLDPPKESALPAINYLREHNINVKVLTGSHRNCF